MARKKKDDDFERNLFGFLLTAYVADAVHLLDKNKALKLAHLGEQYGGDKTWQQHVEEEVSITPAFVRAVFDLAAGSTGGFKGPQWALRFILCGLGCPDVDERLSEVLG